MQQTAPETDALAKRAQDRDADSRHVWLVFADQLTTRIFLECGILDGLRRVLPGRLTAVFLVHEKHVRPWRKRLEGVETIELDELTPTEVPTHERIARRIDVELDSRIGFYPLAIRHSQRHGFHSGRWAPGHSYPFLDTNRAGPLPRWRSLDRATARWNLSSRRYVPSRLIRRMRDECAAVVLTNPQTQASTPFLAAARRLALPTVGYIASWDHPVGKGLVSPYLDGYIVQNETMREDLERFHAIDPARVTVTGWPQTDVYHRRRPRQQYEALLARLGLRVDRPVVLYAGNSPHNTPYEPNLVARLVSWWHESGARERFSLLFRPHPYDSQVQERFKAALDDPEAVVQERSWTDLEDLAVLLQHVDCLIANAGTILLEALVNDRPAVCVTFDEGAPEGRSWADLNLTGEHYRKLLESEAFLRAGNFYELVDALDRALRNPSELAEERLRVAHDVVGDVDGRAAERVVVAICTAVQAGTPGERLSP